MASSRKGIAHAGCFSCAQHAWSWIWVECLLRRPRLSHRAMTWSLSETVAACRVRGGSALAAPTGIGGESGERGARPVQSPVRCRGRQTPCHAPTAHRRGLSRVAGRARGSGEQHMHRMLAFSMNHKHMGHVLARSRGKCCCVVGVRWMFYPVHHQ